MEKKSKAGWRKRREAGWRKRGGPDSEKERGRIVKKRWSRSGWWKKKGPDAEKGGRPAGEKLTCLGRTETKLIQKNMGSDEEKLDKYKDQMEKKYRLINGEK